MAESAGPKPLALHVNGTEHALSVDPATPLLLVLRNQLGLTGAKLACGLEQCGACAVLVEGRATLSCAAAVGDFAGRAIDTVEGLLEDGEPGPVQRAFIAENAAQCGYCTPGLVVAVTALLRRNPVPDKAAIRDALCGHICRCGAQLRVLKAIERLAAEAAR